MKRKLLLQWGAVAGALALALALGKGEVSRASVNAGTFAPELSVDLADKTPEQPADTVVDFNLKKGDEQFAAVVAYIPDTWGIVRGETIPIGAIVGKLTSQATLGLVGAACNTELPVEFDMVNASIDTKDTVSFDDTDKTDRDNTRDYAKDVNPKNGLYDSFDKYPDFINRVFDTPDLQPIRRSAGMAIVASTPVLLQFLVFAPGTLISKDLPNGKELGYPSVTLLQNAGDPDANPEPGPITDFCTPLTSHNISFGVTKDNPKTEGVDESGYTVSVNPKAGKVTFTTAGAGQRDADGDTYENGLDTCPFETNLGDPRVTASGDLDQDGLDAACDPNDDPATSGTNSDQDGDGYLNRQDNCPLQGNGEDATNQHDEDKDQIGDVCDTNKDTADGELILQLPTKDVTIGSGGTGGSPIDSPACSRDGKVVCYAIGSTPGGGGGSSGDNTGKNGEDSGGSSALIFVIIGVVAAVVIVGGGAFALTRRRSS